MKAQAIAMRLVDLGAEVDLDRVHDLLGHAAARAPFLRRSPAPAGISLPRPLAACFPVQGPAGPASVVLHVHETGALVVRLQWTVEADTWAGLRASMVGPNVDGVALLDVLSVWRERLRVSMAHALVDPYDAEVEAERWDVLWLDAPQQDLDQVLSQSRVAIAAVVSDTDREDLTAARVDEAWAQAVRYHPDEVVIPGWDHAVVFATQEPVEVLDTMELANLQLLELRTYDAYLDERLERSFDALDRLWGPGGILRSAGRALRDVSQLRIELARLTDHLSDTGKHFGDWYTAQLHRRLHARFHLADWEAAVQRKMEALEDMFHLAQEAANHRRATALEVMIVLLFILDLILLVRVG